MELEQTAKINVSDNDTAILQTELTSIWQELLQVQNIEPTDRYVCLGGTSAEAIRIVHEIAKRLHISIFVIDIFKYDTIDSLASYLKEQLPAFYVEHSNLTRGKYHDLLPIQKGFYFASQLNHQQNIAYNVSFVMHIQGVIDCEILESSFNSLIRRHEILQAIFYETSQGLIQEQVSQHDNAFKLQYEEVALEDIDDSILRWIQQPMQLDVFPLMQAKLFHSHNADSRLVILQPHIITDGWSLKVLVDECLWLYQRRVSGEDVMLPRIKKGFFDVVSQMHAQSHQHRDYWLKQLAGMQRMAFPHDYRRLQQRNFSGRRYDFFLDEALTRSLNTLASQQNVTVFNWITTVLSVLLSQYCRQEDIVLGCPYANRSQADFAKIIGPLINMLALRIKLSSEQSFADVLQFVKKISLDAFAHSPVDLQDILKTLDARNDATKYDLFDVVMVWQDWYPVPLSVNELSAKPLVFDSKTAKFDLTFEFIPTDSRIGVNIEYRDSLFDLQTIIKLAKRFIEILNQSLATPEIKIHQLAIKRAVINSNQLAPPVLENKFMLQDDDLPHLVFQRCVEKYPTHTALLFGEESLTYEVLNQRANQLAHHIISNHHYQARKRDIIESKAQGKEEVLCVGIYLDKGIDVIVSILAVLKIGAAYIPIDIRSPLKRLHEISDDSKLSLIITLSTHIPHGSGTREQLLCLDEDKDIIRQRPISNISSAVSLDDPIYIIYTSGTSGKPKGVVQSHRNVIRLFYATEGLFGFNAHDTALFFHSHAFDFSVWEIWSALLYGGRLVIPDQLALIDPKEFLHTVSKYQVTVLNQTPSAFQNFMPVLMHDAKDVASLRAVVFGGEALNINMLSPWWDHFDDQYPMMVNMYGITETTVHTTYRILTPRDLQRRESSNIGVPLDDMHTLIVNDHGNMLPEGMPGELIVGGAGVAVCYLNRPELTREKFIRLYSPVARKKMRFYRTGDLVRLLSDGSMEYMGRMDQQLKFRGFRIEKGEIEHTLEQCEGIDRVAVVLHEDSKLQRMIAYYALSNDGLDFDNKALNAFLSERLPSYMIPNLFIKIDKIPLTVNMKIDYRGLPKLATYLLGDNVPVDQSITPAQKKMLAVWKTVLWAPPTSIDDNFFSVGGDSMMALKVVSHASPQGFEINVTDVYRYPTIRLLAHHCWQGDDFLGENTNQETIPFSLVESHDKSQLPANIEDAYPLSSLQLGMLYHYELSPKKAIYLDVFSYKIKGSFDHATFSQAVDILVDENPILRTTFHLESYSEPLQLVHPTAQIPLKIENILEARQERHIIGQWMEKQKQQTFDLQHEPLIRITIHQLPNDAFYLGLTFHHAILDGWSVASMISSLLRSYSSLLSGRKEIRLVKPCYRDYIALEKKVLTSEYHRNFWKKQLLGYGGQNLWKWPTLSSEDDFRMEFLCFKPKLTRELTGIAQKLNVSLDCVLLSGFITLLSIITSSDDVMTGVVFNGRPSAIGTENTLGLFLSTVPFRHKLSASSWYDLILSVAEQKLSLYAYQYYPLAQILKDHDVKQLFDVLFYFTHFHVYSETTDDMPEILQQDIYERTNFPLSFHFNLSPCKDKLTVCIRHENQTYPAAQVQMFSRYLQTILEALVADCHADPKLCSVMKAQERQQLLVDVNHTEVSYDFSKSVNALIEEQAKRYPHHRSIQVQEHGLSYEELVNKVNHAARAFKARGINRGDQVIVFMPRMIEYVVTVLAILKIQAIYIPIDTSQPKHRLNAILEEMQHPWVVTHDTVEHLLDQIDSEYEYHLLSIEALCTQPISNNIELGDIEQMHTVAYMIYTSGSTGRPKGVMITHASLLNTLHSMGSLLQLSEADRWLAITAFSFDISLLEILLPLMFGGTIFLAKEDEIKDPEVLIDHIARNEITCIQATPTTWKMLIASGYRPGNAMKVVSGGEPLTKDISVVLQQADVSYNVYGPTETTIWSTCLPINSDNALLSPMPIGEPISNTKIYVLDHHMQPVPIGVPGELAIAGLGVAEGYYKRSNLSEERFITNHLLPHDKHYGRLYRTGDHVSWLPDGSLYFIGRQDHQFKLRGFRFEAGEIEAAIQEHPIIRSSVALVVNIKGIDSLVVYVILDHSRNSLDEKELRYFLSDKVPSYMLPKRIIALDKLPTNINGKLDLDALRKLPIDMHQGDPIESHAFQSYEQKEVADIWCRALHISSLRVDEDFFAIGGNSLLSIVVVRRINKHFDIHLSIRDFIENPTIKSLSSCIVSHKKGSSAMTTSTNTLNFVKSIPDPIIELKKGGEKSPLFLIHPVGGTIFYYMPLANRLTTDRSVYAIQDPGIEMHDKLFSSLTEMVEFYIQAIKNYQPHGPYFIAGSSFGANAAIEMAQQLSNRGDIVEFVGLIDGWARYPDRANNDKAWFANNLKSQLEVMTKVLPEVEIMDLLLDIHWSRQQFLVNHRFHDKLSQRITLFKAEETMEVLKPLESPYNLWEEYSLITPKVHVVPGDHFTMHLEPNVDHLALALSEYLK